MTVSAVKTHRLHLLRDPKIAHECLNENGFDEVRICPCCAKQGTDGCPHLGHEPTGACKSYSLDERDVQETERRLYAALGVPGQ